MPELMFDFSGRTVVVTGAARGIGREIAALFARSGASVVPVDRDVKVLSEAWGGGSAAIRPVVADVADAASVVAAVESVLEWRGGIDVVVNNAGITRDAVVWKMTDEAWHDVIGVHLTGTFNLTRAAIPAMRVAGFGRVVNVTSYTGLHGNVGQGNYAAAKAGIVGFTKTVAKEVASFGITVNAVSPNAETEMVAAIPADKKASIVAAIPQQRFAAPSEIAVSVGFLASEEAGYITGAVLPVDGGMSM